MGVIFKSVVSAGVGLGVLFGGWVGWRLVSADVQARVYRQRLAQIAGEYRTLQRDYNEAVRRTAVTELVSHEGELWVRVRSAAGDIALMKTPFDPSKEVFADFIVIDGRIWIRRVYDQATTPQDGFVVDDFIEPVLWDDPAVREGKVVYRPLSEGRWLVEVTGSGSLGLVRIGDVPAGGPEELRADVEPELARGVPVSDFEEWLAEVDADTRSIGFGDLIDALLGSSPEPVRPASDDAPPQNAEPADSGR
jgi:hypothetical protein